MVQIQFDSVDPDQKENLLKVQDMKKWCNRLAIGRQIDRWKWMHTQTQPPFLKVKVLWLDNNKCEI